MFTWDLCSDTAFVKIKLSKTPGKVKREDYKDRISEFLMRNRWEHGSQYQEFDIHATFGQSLHKARVRDNARRKRVRSYILKRSLRQFIPRKYEYTHL